MNAQIFRNLQNILISLADDVGTIARMADENEDYFVAYARQAGVLTMQEILERVEDCLENGLKSIREVRKRAVYQSARTS